MPELAMPSAVVPYKFLVDYDRYPQGEIAGLNPVVGDRLAGSEVKSAKTNGDQFVTKVCRRATAEDLAAYQAKMRPKSREKAKLVPITFRTAVGQYRSGEIAGFTPDVARQYCEGYMLGGPSGQRVHAVADYYVDTVDETFDPPEPEKPRPVRRKKPRRKTASMDKQGAPEKK